MKTTRTISLPVDLDEHLQSIAKAETRSISSLCTFYLRQAVSRQITINRFTEVAQDNLRETRRLKREARRAAKAEAAKA